MAASASSRARLTRRTGTRLSPASCWMRSRMGAGSSSWAIQTSFTGRRPGGQQLGHGLAPLDLFAPELRSTRAATTQGERYGRASSSFFSASSSVTLRAKVSSDTRICRALVSMRFSPADRPLSFSRIERFRTTSATW